MFDHKGVLTKILMHPNHILFINNKNYFFTIYISCNISFTCKSHSRVYIEFFKKNITFLQLYEIPSPQID